MNLNYRQWPDRHTRSAELALRRRLDASPATGAASAHGSDETIPPTFVVAFDLLALCLAFAMTRPVAPFVQWLLLPSGPLRMPWPMWLALPENAHPDSFSALPSFIWMLLITAPTTVIFMALLGGYRQIVDQTRTRLVGSSLLSLILSLSIVTLTLFTMKDLNSSRVFMFTFGGLGIVGIVGYRLAIRTFQQRQLAAGTYAKNVIVIGQASAVAGVIDHFHRQVPLNRFRLAGWLSVRANADADARRHGIDLPCLASVEGLGDLLIHRPLHEVIAIQSAGDGNWLRQVIEACDYFRVRLRIVPEALLGGTLRDLKLVFRSEPLRLPEVVLDPPHHESEKMFLKRIIDVAASAALLVVLAPLLAAIAIAIKITTPGLPVLYPWRVIGLKGRSFTGYKFTTMVADADDKRDELVSRNEMTGPVFKVKDDPRITPLGRFLRKYSLNELPQLWSVLKGDMSLVGPRPAFRHELDRYVLWQKRKLCVKPGITCLWQISGRNRINDFDEWVRLDLEYIDRWSLMLDFRILFWTAWAVVGGTGW
jgi:exopolysaccharide biosynthesis polyprenyl glycosylphosphotransferase